MTALGATDPGLLFALGVLTGAIVVIVWLAVCFAWDAANERVDGMVADVLDGPDLDANVRFYDSRPGSER